MQLIHYFWFIKDRKLSKTHFPVKWWMRRLDNCWIVLIRIDLKIAKSCRKCHKIILIRFLILSIHVCERICSFRQHSGEVHHCHIGPHNRRGKNTNLKENQIKFVYPTCLKIRIWIKPSKKKIRFYKFISKQKIISLRHSSILLRIWLNFMAQYLFFSALTICIQFLHFVPGFPTFGLSTIEKT
jgi:hypothetical protein